MPKGSTARFWAFALVLAALANGAGPYLKRTGLIDKDAYRIYWAVHCGFLGSSGAAVRERQCHELTTPAEIRQHALPSSGDVVDTSFRYVYEVTPAERPLKLAKDVLLVLLCAAGAWRLLTGRLKFPPWRESWPLVVLAAYAGIALAASVTLNGPIVGAAGLRLLLVFGAGLLGAAAARHMAAFAVAVALLLGVQLVLAPFEMFRSVHVFHEWSPLFLARRVTGTMVQPNSLGVFAAAAMAFCYSFLPSRATRLPLAAATLAVVLLSGSGTGLVCAALAAVTIFVLRRPPGRRLVAAVGAAVGVALVIAVVLPVLSGRADIFDSVASGRLDTLRAALLDRSAWDLFFGSGPGVNTNLALSLQAAGSPAGGSTGPAPAPTDSALTGLLIQIGLLGTGLFYATLAWAARRDPRARPFYAVIALCTLTINVTELFPVNFLLGIAWAHSLWARSGASLDE